MKEEDKCKYNSSVTLSSLMQHSKSTKNGVLHLGIHHYLDKLTKDGSKNSRKRKFDRNSNNNNNNNNNNRNNYGGNNYNRHYNHNDSSRKFRKRQC